MRQPFRLPATLASAAAFCGVLAACGDAPTSPTSFAQQAGGKTWVAVAPPAKMPEARTWIAYATPQAAARIREMQQQASRARRAGMLEAALEMDAQAARLSASFLAKDPPTPKVIGAVSAVREWEQRAEDRLREGDYPGLDSALAVVSAQRAAAEAALARGDGRGAVLRLADAAEAARAYAPQAVALNLVARAEQRIDRDPAPTPDLKRARLLLRLAREAMATGDQTRAMKRAWYALQIIDAHDGRGGR
ncbi:MAG TPA: hypothetical protein VF771_17815 [Longimicrobiaceae bacterium]